MTIQLYDCPVPIDQRPINEYRDLKTSSLFFWTTRPLNSYLKTLITFTIIVCTSVSLLINVSIANSELVVNFLGYSLTFGSIIMIFGILRVYLGWVYIYERLVKASVTYEESGWYDGQTWIKPPESLIQDKLIATYEILPIVTRLKQSLIFFCTITLMSIEYLKDFN